MLSIIDKIASGGIISEPPPHRLSVSTTQCYPCTMSEDSKHDPEPQAVLIDQDVLQLVTMLQACFGGAHSRK
jgi:hypothetical protein